MTTARIHINLTKWGQTGETPEAFIERMTSNIKAVQENGLAFSKKMLAKVSDEQARAYYEGQVRYEERKISRWAKEIKKAQQAI